jgi:hypothetical protein
MENALAIYDLGLSSIYAKSPMLYSRDVDPGNVVRPDIANRG